MYTHAMAGARLDWLEGVYLSGNSIKIQTAHDIKFVIIFPQQASKHFLYWMQVFKAIVCFKGQCSTNSGLWDKDKCFACINNILFFPLPEVHTHLVSLKLIISVRLINRHRMAEGQ